MNRTTTVMVLAGLAIFATGCSSTFQASAPTKSPNQRYVVGAEGGFFGPSPMIWLCPTDKGEDAECQEVEIVE